MKFPKNSCLLALVLSSLLLSGCAAIGDFLQPQRNTTPPSWAPQLPSGAAKTATTGSRPLRQDDRVLVTVTAGSATPIQVTDIVDSHGNITLLHIGEFKVGQLTTSEAEKAIRESYIENGLFTSPDVTVLCEGMIPQLEYFVTGAINKKGSFLFKDGITLWQAIVAAGDVTPFASSKVKLVRNGVAKEYDIRRIKNNSSENPLLMPGDMIEVLESWL